MKKTVLYLCIVLLGWLSALAQPGYTITRYGVKEGLSNQEARVVFEDSRGFIWTGTAFGLNMFDGQNFFTWHKIAGDSNSLSHNSILTITEDKLGRLWIGTQNGVSCFDLLTRKFINYNPSGKGIHQLNAEHCHVYIDREQTIWIGHNKGIIAMNSATGAKQYYAIALEEPGENRNRYVNGFMEDSNGRIWVSTSFGMYVQQKNKAGFEQVRVPAHLYTQKKPAVTGIHRDSRGRVYSGVWNGGLLQQINGTDSFRFIRFPSAFPVTFTVFTIRFFEGMAWLGTSSGIMVIGEEDLAAGRIADYYFITDEETGTESALQNTNSVIRDHNGIWWAGSSSGMMRIMKKSNLFTPVSYLPYSDFNVQSFASVPDQTGVYMLSKNRILRYTFATGQITALPGVFPLSSLRHIALGKNGYWLSTKSGLLSFDKGMKRPTPVNEVNRMADSRFFSSVFEDSRGLVWLGAAGRNGIRIYDPEQKTLQSYFDKPGEAGSSYGHSIIQFTEDGEGNIWIATMPVLRYIRSERRFEVITIPAEQSDSLEANSVNSLYVGSDHQLWMGTLNGLHRYDLRTRQFQSYKLPAHIPPRIDGITEDSNGNLWLSSNAGLVFFNRKQNTFKLFNQLNGAPAGYIGNALVNTPDGHIIFSFDGGICVADPAQLPAGKSIPQPRWTAIQTDNTPLGEALQDQPVTLRYNQSISFSFLSPDYSSASPNQYAYILDGLDKTWTSIGNTTTQRFSNLPPGTYTFKVKAGSNDGTWNETATSFRFVVRPPFWKTWWFITGILLLTGFIIYAFYRNRLQQALQMERLRTRIATDLHDDIGATLSSISMYSEAVKNQVKEHLPHLEPVLNKMGENSREMVTNMSDIVWAINPDNDNGKKLVQRMESYARDICAVKNVQLNFEGDEKLDEQKLPLEHRKNIYLIFKEALNNALKYAMATEITIRIRMSGAQTLQLLVADNGKGFNTAGNPAGNGLKNMRLRSEEIGAALRIESAENKGTTVELVCPLDK